MLVEDITTPTTKSFNIHSCSWELWKMSYNTSVTSAGSASNEGQAGKIMSALTVEGKVVLNEGITPLINLLMR